MKALSLAVLALSLFAPAAHAAPQKTVPGSFICFNAEGGNNPAMDAIQKFLVNYCDPTKQYSLTGGRTDWDNGETYAYAVCCIAK